MNVFEANTADEAWLQAAHAIRTEGVLQPGRGGDTLELLHAIFHIHDPRQRWVASRSPAMNPAFALAEVIWLLNGHEDSYFLNFWNPRLPRYAGRSITYHGAYGKRLRDWFGIDQLQRAARILEDKPDSRQVFLQIWDPARDLPVDRGQPADADIPCNVGASLKVRNGRLEWLQVVRSNDLFLGVPHNLVLFTVLQEVLAGWIGVQPGNYTHVSDSLHIYTPDLPTVESSVRAESPAVTADIALPRRVSEPALRALDQSARRMTDASLSFDDLIGLVSGFEGPEEFANWLRILGAESARRRGWQEISSEFAESCTSACLSAMWRHWQARVVDRDRTQPKPMYMGSRH